MGLDETSALTRPFQSLPMTRQKSAARPQRRHPLSFVVLSILFCLTLDAGIFRSGVYGHIATPRSFDHTLAYEVPFERERVPSGKAEVLLLDNSRLGDSFSIADFQERQPDAPIKFIRGTVPGSDDRDWYYAANAFDPIHDRYRAIVIPAYAAYRTTTELPNYSKDAKILGPILSAAEWFDVISTGASWGERCDAVAAFFLRGLVYDLDVQDLGLDPGKRVTESRWLYRVKGEWDFERERVHHDFDGNLMRSREWMSMDGFRYDPSTGTIVGWPQGMTDAARAFIAKSFGSRTPDSERENTAQSAAFAEFWLDRIIRSYRGSKTRIIFLQLPRWPFPLPQRRSLPDAPDLRTVLAEQDNVTYLDEHLFDDLEAPRYFQDTDHLSTAGRDSFTDIFGAEIMRRLGVVSE